MYVGCKDPEVERTNPNLAQRHDTIQKIRTGLASCLPSPLLRRSVMFSQRNNQITTTMGLFTKMLQQAQAEAEKLVQQKLGVTTTSTGNSTSTSSSTTPPTRWEKALVAMNGIVAQVSTIDPDGVDVVCFGGGGDNNNKSCEIYRNIKDTKGLDGMVTQQEPSGACHMGAAMDTVLQEAFARGFAEQQRPCSILVLTAGQPDDATALTTVLQEATQKVAGLPRLPHPKQKSKTLSPLTITFVQVGDDNDAEAYLRHLDDNLTTEQNDGTTVDIVDTIKDEELQKAMRELQGSGSGKAAAAGTAGGALLGAFAGAAMGVGGMYVFNKINAKKRTKGWNGNWKATYDGEEVGTLQVVDDLSGGLQISGFPSDGDEPAKTTGSYTTSEDGGFNIQFAEVATGDAIIGTIEDEHSITWSDGTHWKEVKPDGSTDWKAYMGAAAAGASAAGATGSLLGKKFFDKASHKIPSDYVILLDRSAMMAVPDTGK